MYQQVEIKSWSEFNLKVEILDVKIDSELIYGYRGQSVADWKLTPSFYRHCNPEQIPTKDLLAIEKLATEEFFSQAHLHIPSNIMNVSSDFLSKLTLMQQHNAHTRLLDWTLSPYVAAYFACEKNFEQDGAIWILSRPMLEIRMNEIHNNYDFPNNTQEMQKKFTDPNAPNKVFFIRRKSKTERMVAQQGIYTVCCNISGDQHNIISETMPDQNEKVMFIKLVIPRQLKKEFLKKLRIVNIMASSLFPGIDGFGKSISELIHLKVNDFCNNQQKIEPLKANVEKTNPN